MQVYRLAVKSLNGKVIQGDLSLQPFVVVPTTTCRSPRARGEKGAQGETINHNSRIVNNVSKKVFIKLPGIFIFNLYEKVVYYKNRLKVKLLYFKRLLTSFFLVLESQAELAAYREVQAVEEAPA